MKRKIWNYFVPLAALVSSIAIWIFTSTDMFDSILAEVVRPDKIPGIKETLNIFDFCVLVIPLGVQSIMHANGATRCKEVIATFAHSQRRMTAHALKENGYVNDIGADIELNIRIFRKRFNRLVLEDKMEFCANETQHKLSFSIKKQEGLCTKAYAQSHSMLESEDGSRKDYNLTNRQKALAGDLKFIVAVPIVTESGKPSKRVICFDSSQKLAKRGCEQGILKSCESIAYQLNSVIG